MNSGVPLALSPINDCVLVELQQSYKNFQTSEGKYDSRTEGIVVAVPEYMRVGFEKESKVDVLNLVNKRVFFEEFKEGSRIKRGDKIYSFIKIEDIRGYEDVETN